jgi:translation initiation factor 1 (eIF-1/SUI1)
MSKKLQTDGAGFGASFGDLLKARGLAPPADPAPQTAPPAPSAPNPTPTADPLDLAKAGKLVVRRENKGRGGKTVTLVTGLPEPHLEAFAKALKTAMGCGAVVEETSVVLQGDQTARVMPWLTARGARQVVRGN